MSEINKNSRVITRNLSIPIQAIYVEFYDEKLNKRRAMQVCKAKGASCLFYHKGEFMAETPDWCHYSNGGMSWEGRKRCDVLNGFAVPNYSCPFRLAPRPCPAFEVGDVLSRRDFELRIEVISVEWDEMMLEYRYMSKDWVYPLIPKEWVKIGRKDD